MNFFVEFLNRDFTERSSYPWHEVKLRNFIKSAVGGPKVANLTVEGNPVALWELADMIRAPVIIWDAQRSKKIWWGYISQVTLHVNGKRRTVGMRYMANRVAVAYVNNNVRETTTFAADTDSVNEFGKKEIIKPASSLDDTQAQNYRDTILEQQKYPAVGVPISVPGTRNYAEIKCQGWWETLRWQYYSNAAGEEKYTDLDSFPGRTVQKSGDGRPRFAMSFTNSAGSNWDATKIYLRARKVEEGIGISDDLEVYLYDDSGGEPNASQASASMAAANIDTYMDWIEFELDSSVTLTDGATYWIVVQNETYPQVDGDDYFFVDGNSSEGYPNGSLLLYNVNSASWETWSQPCDINFRVLGEKVTTTQVENIVSDAGEFIVDTDTIDASGLSTNPYRDGDNTAQYEIKKLLEKGTTNDKRLLAHVRDNYYLEVYVEPDRYDADYTLSPRQIRTDKGAVVPPADCPVGVWMRYIDSIPGTVNVDRLVNSSHIFVEEAEYRASDNSYNILRARGISELKELFGVLDG